MSPEQARGQGVDFRSDQFTFGAILYELATGRQAFRRESPAQTIAAIIEDQPESLATRAPGLPGPLRWVIERCLAKDPTERYASTLDLSRELRGLREHIGEVGGSASSPAGPPRPVTRRRMLTLGLVALVAVPLATWLGPPLIDRATLALGLRPLAGAATRGGAALPHAVADAGGPGARRRHRGAPDRAARAARALPRRALGGALEQRGPGRRHERRPRRPRAGRDARGHRQRPASRRPVAAHRHARGREPQPDVTCGDGVRDRRARGGRRLDAGARAQRERGRAAAGGRKRRRGGGNAHGPGLRHLGLGRSPLRARSLRAEPASGERDRAVQSRARARPALRAGARRSGRGLLAPLRERAQARARAARRAALPARARARRSRARALDHARHDPRRQRPRRAGARRLPEGPRPRPPQRRRATGARAGARPPRALRRSRDALQAGRSS